MSLSAIYVLVRHRLVPAIVNGHIVVTFKTPEQEANEQALNGLLYSVMLYSVNFLDVFYHTVPSILLGISTSGLRSALIVAGNGRF